MVFIPWIAGLLSEDIFFEWPFFFEVAIAGLLSGVMYSLVALGFVLIFKASGVFNFAQGAIVLFAALTLVGFNEMGLPMWAAVIVTILIMILLAIVIERVVLSHLVNHHWHCLLSGWFWPNYLGIGSKSIRSRYF
jgi:branched-chain amino acid transport system permease protein